MAGKAVEVLATIRIESVDVIKVSHFIQNLMDEPEIWLLPAAVVQSFEIMRPRVLDKKNRKGGTADNKHMEVKVAPTCRTARNITITSHRANILSLADFGIAVSTHFREQKK